MTPDEEAKALLQPILDVFEWTLYEGCPYKIVDSKHFQHFYVLLPGGGTRLCNTFEDAVAELEACVADDIASLSDKLGHARRTLTALKADSWHHEDESEDELEHWSRGAYVIVSTPESYSSWAQRPNPGNFTVHYKNNLLGGTGTLEEAFDYVEARECKT